MLPVRSSTLPANVVCPMWEVGQDNGRLYQTLDARQTVAIGSPCSDMTVSSPLASTVMSRIPSQYSSESLQSSCSSHRLVPVHHHRHLQNHSPHGLRMLKSPISTPGSSPCPFGASTFSIASSSSSTNSEPDSVSSNTSATSLQVSSGLCKQSLEPQVVIKVHSRVLCPAVEYKTLSVSTRTTCKDIVEQLLAKFRMKHRDPDMFYITMEVWMKTAGIPLRCVMVLDDDACPAHLQLSYPHQQTKFTLCVRRVGIYKI
ncbi:hypothetical protein HDE_07302 [Halotydeus destructor]|nr:hypothetical protein HDE_07302 [Halotydeus destructor]